MKQQAKFKDRLEYALSERKMKPVDLHRLTGISESTISQYRSGYAEPKKRRLTIIASALNVDPSWLMGLDVPMEHKEYLHNALITAYDKAEPNIQEAVRLLLDINEK